MQLNNADNILSEDINKNKNYSIDNVYYSVHRFFDSDKTLKDIILENISNEKYRFQIDKSLYP